MMSKTHLGDRFGRTTAVALPLVAILLAAILALPLACEKKGGGGIKIGAVLPLTGSASLLGTEVQQGINIAVKEINGAGGIGGKNFRVIFEDSRNNPAEGVSALRKLIELHKVSAVISEMSSVSRAIIPVADQNDVVVFATVTATPKLTETSEWVFRYYYTTDVQGRTIAEFMTSRLGLKRIGVLHLNDDYGRSSFDFFRGSFEELGGEIVGSEAYESSATDVRTELTKLKNIEPEGILIIAYDRALSMAFRQAKELAVQIPLFTYTGLADPSVLEQTGDAAEGVYLTVSTYDPANPPSDKQRSFVERYQQEFGRLPGHYPAFGYDVTMCIAEAIRNVGCSSTEIRTGLSAIKDFTAVMGNISVMSNREVSFPQVVKVVREGKIVPIDD